MPSTHPIAGDLRVRTGEPLRVLMVEDSEDDMDLVLDELRQGGFDPACERVDHAATMEAALRDRPWDIVISDWTVPTFGALPALAIFRSMNLDIPFLVVSGTVGEEIAAEAIRTGAHDFVHKDRLAPLARVVRRERRDAADRAEQRRLREQLRVARESLSRSEKLLTLGQMAAGIAHDVKNLLNPLSLHIQLLRRSMNRGALEDANGTLDEMNAVLRRGVETLERLRRFSRRPDAIATAERLDLNHVTHEAIEIARPRMAMGGGALCTIREAFGAPPPIQAGAEEIVCSIVNLVVNAIDVLPDGGTITLCTGDARGGARLTVADDGPGMPPDVAARVFDPFFTTKGEKGTGIGLSMVEDCVRRHGGSVSLDTALGKGATFELWFPAAPDGVRDQLHAG